MRGETISRWVIVAAAAAIGCSGSLDGSDTDSDGSTGTETDTNGSTSASGTTTSPNTTGQDSDSSASTSGNPSTSGDGTSDTSNPDTTETTGTSVECPATSLPPGEYTNLELMHDGLTRTYDIYVPAAHDGSTAVPVVFNHHGFTSNKGQQAAFSGMNPDAEDAGYVVVYPNGTNSSWNAGACCGLAVTQDVDDVGFIRALVEHVQTQVCADPDRIYATGMSNGGFLSHRLACEASDLFAAIAPVAGVLGIAPEDCQPQRAVPVIDFHGTADQLVSYDGGTFAGVVETAQGWADRNGCDPQSQVGFMMDDVTCETWSGCDDGAEVTLCSIEGFGHCWPGQSFCPFLGTTDTISANVEMFEFFDAHPM